MKILELFIFVGDGHASKIWMMANSLEVATYEEQVDFIMMLGFKARYLRVDGVELAVAASFDRDLNEGRVRAEEKRKTRALPSSRTKLDKLRVRRGSCRGAVELPCETSVIDVLFVTAIFISNNVVRPLPRLCTLFQRNGGYRSGPRTGSTLTGWYLGLYQRHCLYM